MKASRKKEKPGFFSKTIIVFVAFLFSACTFPKLSQTSQIATVTPDIKISFAFTETATPTQDDAYSACYFNWAHVALPELSREFEKALKDIQPQAEGFAEA